MEAVKRQDRLPPTLVHVCGFIWEWTQAKSKSPLNTRGGISEEGGSQIQKSGEAVNGWTDWPQIWHTSAEPSGNGYTSNKLTLETQGGHLGGFRGQTFKSMWKLSNGRTDCHQLWFTSADSSGNGHRLNPSRPSIPEGAFRRKGVTNSKVCGSRQTAGPIGPTFGTHLQIHLGMDIRQTN